METISRNRHWSFLHDYCRQEDSNMIIAHYLPRAFWNWRGGGVGSINTLPLAQLFHYFIFFKQKCTQETLIKARGAQLIKYTYLSWYNWLSLRMRSKVGNLAVLSICMTLYYVDGASTYDHPAINGSSHRRQKRGERGERVPPPRLKNQRGTFPRNYNILIPFLFDTYQNIEFFNTF